ncbi:hypothetical protein EJB05_29733, partial [Eragrostis curvula]
MVKDFWARNKYTLFSKSQIQEKERELKRDYKMLKEALKQSGCSWNKDRDEEAPPRNRLREERKKLQPASTVHQRRMRTKQGEEEAAMLARENEAAMLARENEAAMLARENQPTQATDFSITRCIKVLNTMEVTKEEKVKAFSVFTNVDNREIFLSSAEGDEETALLWLMSQI